MSTPSGDEFTDIADDQLYNSTDAIAGLLLRALTRLLRIATGTHLYLHHIDGKVDLLMTQARATQADIDALTQQVTASDQAIQQAVQTLQGLIDQAQAQGGPENIDLTSLQAAVDSLAANASADTQLASDETAQGIPGGTTPPTDPGTIPTPPTDGDGGGDVTPPVDGGGDSGGGDVPPTNGDGGDVPPTDGGDTGGDVTPPTDGGDTPPVDQPPVDTGGDVDPGSGDVTPDPPVDGGGDTGDPAPEDPNLNPAVDPDDPNQPVINPLR